MPTMRNPRIDALRGIAILLVLFHHFNIAYRLEGTWLAAAFGWPAVRAVARNGNYGVIIFFAISGFLITSNVCHRWQGIGQIGLADFYRLRIARILPGLLLLLCLVDLLAVAGLAIFQNRVVDGSSLPMWRVNLAAAAFHMNALIARHGWVNYPLGVLWSLAVEEVFYLAFPLACLALKSERRLLALMALVIVIGPLYRFAHPNDEGEFLYGYWACFDSIAIGCCTAILSRNGGFTWLERRGVRIALGASMALLYLAWPIAQSKVLGCTAMAAGAALLLVAAQRKRPPRATLAARVLAACGRLSYELYLFHLIVLGLMRTVFSPQIVSAEGKIALLVGYFLVSAAVAAGISRVFSEPMNRMIRARVTRPNCVH
ncbi:acyltransferase family protein [Herbaspirillum sp. NPDC087042]|uniref:acyltransferase family protein n=1 Tax=Herbaspirillum sp. NPDC087042 TaxID=3364004 RepID=UPI0038022350